MSVLVQPRDVNSGSGGPVQATKAVVARKALSDRELKAVIRAAGVERILQLTLEVDAELQCAALDEWGAA